MQNEPQPSVKRIYARICIIIGILGIACTYSPLILPVPWKTETKVLLVVIGGILILCSLVIKFPSAAVPVLRLGRPDPAVVSERYLLLPQSAATGSIGNKALC